jgi:tRNA uridine 5-carbamoylmethylation protein Kti12
MPSVILLTGLPGTGKLTVANELVRLMAEGGETVKLVDNHYWNNVVFALLDPDGETPLGPEVWERVFEVGEAVWRTMEELSPPEWSFVITAAVGHGDEWFLDRLATVAEHRNSTFTVVRLHCDLDELERRIAAPGRAEHHKMTSVPGIRELHAEGNRVFDRPNVIQVDTTNLAPAEAGARILDHVVT